MKKETKGPTLFDVISEVSQKREGILDTPMFRKNPNDPDWEFDEESFRKMYNPATINKALGPHPDALFILDALNVKGKDPLFHCELLMSILQPRIRRGKWMKEIKNEDIEIIADYYNVRLDVAAQYHRNINKDDIIMMKSALEQRASEK